MTLDAHTELAQQPLGDGPGGDARGGLPRARPLEDVARVLSPVLEHPREVRVSRTRQVHPAQEFVVVHLRRLDRHRRAPVPEVAVGDADRDRSPQRLPEAHPAEDLAHILLDLHAAPAAVPALPARQLPRDILGRERQSGGDPFQHGHHGGAVRFARRGQPQTPQHFVLIA